MQQHPRHLAIIMDGNGRWAEEHSLPRIAGHRRGVEVSEEIITACQDWGVEYLTLYAFSEENWNRPDAEVHALMELLEAYVRRKRPEMVADGIRFRTIGDIDRLPAGCRQEIEATCAATTAGRSLTLILALSYGARQEICRAVERLVARGVSAVTPEVFDSVLDTATIPDPDLLIRTSGEYRISNFLLWQLAYTEFYFTETLWPDFNAQALAEAFAVYARRERRFGLTSEQLQGATIPKGATR